MCNLIYKDGDNVFVATSKNLPHVLLLKHFIINNINGPQSYAEHISAFILTIPLVILELFISI